jgi:hypothetical protein
VFFDYILTTHYGANGMTLAIFSTKIMDFLKI